MPLREAICAWHKRELGSSYEAKECVVSVAESTHLQRDERAYSAGDEVIIRAVLVSFPDM